MTGATARHYAQAVFSIASEQGTLDRWRDDLRTLAEYFGNRRLQFVLREPQIPAPRKEAIVRDLLATKVQHDVLNLALLLVQRELVEIAPKLSEQYEALYNEARGQAEAIVTTAIPLDDALRTQITNQLAAITGKRILLRERVDPSILGGAIARVGDTLIDGSLRRRFALLRERIAQGGLGGDAADGMDFADLFGPQPGAPGGSAPFVVSPSTAPGDGNGNVPPMANEAAPRAAERAHLAPRGAAQPQRTGRSKRRKR